MNSENLVMHLNYTKAAKGCYEVGIGTYLICRSICLYVYHDYTKFQNYNIRIKVAQRNNQNMFCSRPQVFG